MEALFGLAGIIVGAVLSWAGATWNERSKRRHEGRILVRGEKLEAYSSFSAATKEYIAVLYRVAGGMGIDEQTEKLTMEEAGPLLAENFRARDRAFEQIRLVGSDTLIARARTWVQLVYEMRNYLDSAEIEAGDWSRLVDRANEARDFFHVQAREELAVA